jgi:uncharacterized protein Veg
MDKPAQFLKKHRNEVVVGLLESSYESVFIIQVTTLKEEFSIADLR